ncbi:hypothetical protein K2173_007311 [Erythroxylum novogranatense]|uniref:Cytochrome P450 n=1 Tax=Erythroxylum novogranatense TaxID=1862640 RepID=A0AAV8T5V1_9ROSI|nr:hypothetical protein K2173_007311 [Erythroxylum novogranatense]
MAEVRRMTAEALSKPMTSLDHKILSQSWVPEMTAKTMKMLEKWELTRAERDDVEIDVHKHLHQLSTDIISSAIFGSRFEEGKYIFELHEKQMLLASAALKYVAIPLFRFLPIPVNIDRWRLDKKLCREDFDSSVSGSGSGFFNRSIFLRKE